MTKNRTEPRKWLLEPSHFVNTYNTYIYIEHIPKYLSYIRNNGASDMGDDFIKNDVFHMLGLSLVILSDSSFLKASGTLEKCVFERLDDDDTLLFLLSNYDCNF